MVARCISDDQTGLDLAMEFALTLSDEDIHSIAGGLVHDSIKRNEKDHADYLLASCLLDGCVILRQALKDVAAGKLVAVSR